MGLIISAVIIFGLSALFLSGRIDLISGNVQKRLSKLEKQIGDPDIYALIKNGESTILEFKETFELDKKDVPKNIEKEVHIQEYKNRQKKELFKSSLKSIVGFLNADGGTLLIGVDDGGEVTGMGEEIGAYHQGSNDKFLLRFENALDEHVGVSDFPQSRYIEYQLTDVGSKLVFKINCNAIEPDSSFQGIFLRIDGEDYFHVRQGPRTKILKGKSLISYLENRFPRSK